MEFVLNRSIIHASRLGHTIKFEKGVKTHVPPELWSEVQAIGAVPAEDLPEVTREDSHEPLDPNSRKEAIFTAFAKLVSGAKREDFSATGFPHAKAVSRVAKFEIDKKECESLWQEYKLRDKAE